MKHTLQILIISGLIFSSYFSFGQCRNIIYKCAKEAIYLRDFNTDLKRMRHGGESGTKWPVVLNKGTQYYFMLYTRQGSEDKVIMKLYDSQHQEKTNPLGETYYDGSKITGFYFVCERSGMYHVSIRFRPCESLRKTSAVGILYFIGKQDFSFYKNEYPVYYPKILKDKNSEGLKIYRNLKGISNFDAVEILDLSGSTSANLPNDILRLKNLKEIQLPCNKCFDLHQADSLLRQLPNLKSLKIKTSNLVLLREYLETLNYFEELDISRCCLQQVPSEIFKMKNLRILNISYNSIEKNQKNFNSMKYLTEINFSNNKLTNLPEGNLNFKKINIKNNYIYFEEIKEFIEKSKNLEEITIFKNALVEKEKISLKNEYAIISDEPEPEPVLYETNPEKAFKNPENTRKYRDIVLALKDEDIVYQLDISHLNIKFLPKEFKKCKNLINLNLENNSLRNISDYISEFKHLKQLNIRNNKLSENEKRKIKKLCPNTKITATFYKLYPDTHFLNKEELKTAKTYKDIITAKEDANSVYKFSYYSNKALKSNAVYIEDVIGFKNIQDLSLVGSGITEIPKEINTLTKLQRLNLKDNSIKILPKEILLLQELKYINLSKNKFDVLPEEIYGLTNLESLYFSKNKITTLSSDIQKLINLRTLNLSENSITKLPDEICQLNSITSLYLSNNSLKKLPAKIGELSNLEKLSLENNLLEKLPRSIYKLKKLKTIELSGNKISKDELMKIKKRFKTKLPNCQVSAYYMR